MKETIETTGTVAKVLGNNQYIVDFEHQGQPRNIRCYLSGRMRQHMISIKVLDKVKIEIPHPYEMARITYREKG